MNTVTLILLSLAAAILLALAIPVTFSTKYRNERVRAEEYAKEFRIYAWNIRLDSIKRIDALKVEVFHTSNAPDVSKILLAELSPTKQDLLNHNQLSIRIFMRSDGLRLRVGENQVNVSLPFPISEDDVVPYNLGGEGQLISPSSFLLIKHPGGSITATMTGS